LPLSGIQRLRTPLIDALDEPLAPQQNALRIAFGISSRDTPDTFLVAGAVLNLLAAIAARRPLLCIVDDGQWIDATSLQVLGFVGRRLAVEPFAMIFALREPATVGPLDGLPRLSIEGLDEPDARALLSRVPGRLDDRIRNRIACETGGNPLALVELSHGMSRAERASGFALPSAGDDVPSRMEERYLRRVIDLPGPTQRLLLLAAAGPLGDAVLVWRAAGRLSGPANKYRSRDGSGIAGD
jgi:hypothetical protein